MPRVLTQELDEANRTAREGTEEIDIENGLSANEEGNILINGGANTVQTHESEASNRINSFNRLYYDGLQ